MRISLSLLLLCSLLTSCSVIRGSSASPEKKRSILTRWIPPLPKFGGGEGDRSERKLAAALRRIEMELIVLPAAIKLSEARRLDITAKLVNSGRELVQLQFPTAQRIEIIILDEKGAKVTQWSEDQLFAQGQSYLSINPGERVQYDVKLATRDLAAGRTYTVEAFVPGYDALKKRVNIAPQ